MACTTCSAMPSCVPQHIEFFTFGQRDLLGNPLTKSWCRFAVTEHGFGCLIRLLLSDIMGRLIHAAMNLILNLLKKIPLFQSLTEQEHLSIVKDVELQYFPADYTLFKQGDMGVALYIVKTGSVTIFTDKGELATLKEGDFFGEMALIEDQPRMASAKTTQETELFVLRASVFAELLKKAPEILAKVKVAYDERKAHNQQYPFTPSA